MTYAYYYDVPAGEHMYRQVMSGIDDLQPAGLVTHLVVKHDGGLRHFGVWETKEEWERYRDEKVRPAVDRVLLAAGFPQTPPPPAEHEMDVVDVMTGTVKV